MDDLLRSPQDRAYGETDFCAAEAANVENGSQESTLNMEAMEAKENHQIRSPSPSEMITVCENESVEPNINHCLICYKNVSPSSACETEFDNFTNPSTWQLLKVFCKYVGVQVPSDSDDDEAEVDGIFCEKCHDSMRLLSRLDTELESVQKMISKLILGCTVAVIESPRIAWQSDCHFLGRVREDIFNRYCPQISLRDCCKEEDRVSSDNDDVGSFASYMVPDIEMGSDEGNNADDEVIGLTDDEEHELPSKVEVVKRKALTVDAVQALPEQLQRPSTSSQKKTGTFKRKKKIVRKVRTHPPVKRIFKEKPVLPPRGGLRDRGKIFKSDEVIVLDGPSSSQAVQAPKYIEIKGGKTKLQETEPGKYLYLKRFNFAKVNDDNFQCSSCDVEPVDSIEDAVSHIRSTHLSERKVQFLEPPKSPRKKRQKGYSFYIHKIRIDYNGGNYHCSLCPYKKRLRNLIKMHISFKHYLPFLKLKQAGQVEGTLGEEPENLTNKEENAAASIEEPKGSPKFEYIEYDEDSESEDPMSEEDDFIPDEIIRQKKEEERKQNLRLKLIEPGKYLYLDEYELQKTEDGMYVCLLCKDRKRSRQLLLSHIKRVHVNRKELNLKKHRLVDIGNDEFLYGDKVKITKFENQYSCGECGFLSEKLGTVRGHIRDRHLQPPKTEPEPIMCEDCGKMLMGEKALGEHRDRMHSEAAEKPFVCPTCGKGFVRVRLLNQHVRTHDRKNYPKNFVCEHCGKAFSSRQKLLSHATTHTGETPFECVHCGKKFKQYNVMTVHRKACRTSAGQAPATQAIAPAECVIAEYQQLQEAPVPLNIAPYAPPPIPFEFFPALYGSGR